MASKTVEINREALDDLVRIRAEFDAVMESLELSKDRRFVSSYKKAKNEILKRDFVDWNAL